jgi:hypothetical protein
MAEETLFTAARRVVRDVRIDDERHGGLISRTTIQSLDTLAMQIRMEEQREAAAKAAVVPPPAPAA